MDNIGCRLAVNFGDSITASPELFKYGVGKAAKGVEPFFNNLGIIKSSFPQAAAAGRATCRFKREIFGQHWFAAHRANQSAAISRNRTLRPHLQKEKENFFAAVFIF